MGGGTAAIGVLQTRMDQCPLIMTFLIAKRHTEKALCEKEEQGENEEPANRQH